MRSLQGFPVVGKPCNIYPQHICIGFLFDSYSPFPQIVQVFPSGTPQFPVPVVFMGYKFAVYPPTPTHFPPVLQWARLTSTAPYAASQLANPAFVDKICVIFFCTTWQSLRLRVICELENSRHYQLGFPLFVKAKNKVCT